MKVTTAKLAYQYMCHGIQWEVEEFWAMALNSEKSVLRLECLFRGTVDVCLFHPRDLFRFAYKANAASLIVGHNHPSGNPMPSPQDVAVTRKILVAAKILQVPVLDHIILTRAGYYSFLEAGALPRNIKCLV